MATLEEAGLGLQLIQNLYGLVRNMRDNATAYKDNATNPNIKLDDIALIMKQDAVQYARRAQWIMDLVSRNETVFISALTAFGIKKQEASDLNTLVMVIASGTQAASITTVNDVNKQADTILASTPQFEKIF